MRQLTARKQALLSLPIILLTVLISGCGFQLRSATEVPPELSPVFIQAPLGSRTAAALVSALRSSQVEFAADAGQASTLIRILDEREDSRVLAVNSQGKIIGTELQLRVTFDAVARDRSVLAQSQSIDLAREYVNPEVEVIGKVEEAQLIRSDMVQDMADRILHRLKAQILN